MRTVFINLDSAVERRAALEANFAAVAPAGWTLERFAAVGATEAAKAPGSLSPGAKGCFLSHLAVLGSAPGDEHLLVLEDDATLSAHAPAALPEALGLGWDAVFGDVAPGNIGVAVELGALFDQRGKAGAFALVDLSARQFSGSTAYVITAEGRRKVLAAAANLARLDRPYDIFLRDLIHAGELRAAVCAPFVTSIGSEADTSQIQSDGAGFRARCLNAVRRILYADRDLSRCDAETSALMDDASPTSTLLGRVFAAMTSDRM